MKAALIGPPLSGKSTLFAAVTASPIDPALALQEHTLSIKVPDARLDYLTAIYKPKKTVEATIEFSDFPGISSTDEQGKQQYRKHMPNIRQCDLLVAVVRDFQNDAVAPHKNRIDPKGDLDALYDDFVFADLEAVVNRLDKLEKSFKRPSKTRELEKKEHALLVRCQQVLEDLQPLSEVLEHEDDNVMLRSFAFLTQKPLIAVINVAESSAAAEPSFEWDHAGTVMDICADAEEQIAELNEEDRAVFLEDLGITTPARDRLIQTCYSAAGLVSFLTVGDDEVRAWPVRKGASAVEAASKVHSDIARGFIRAETVAYEDFVEAGGDMKTVKAAGKLRQEGKTYVVRDGDMINFKFNV